MSRTRRTKITTCWWLKESTLDRRWWRRRFRQQCKQQIRAERYDQMPIYKRTEGWFGW